MGQVIALSCVSHAPESTQMEKNFDSVIHTDYNLLAHTMAFVEEAQAIQTALFVLFSDIGDDHARYCRNLIDQVESLYALKDRVYLNVVTFPDYPFQDWRKRFVDAGAEDRAECTRLCVAAVSAFHSKCLTLHRRLITSALESKSLLRDRLATLEQGENRQDTLSDIDRLVERYSYTDLDYFQGA